MPDKDNLIDRTPAATHGAAGTIPPGPGSARVVFFNISHPLSLSLSLISSQTSTIARRSGESVRTAYLLASCQTWTIPVIFGHGGMVTLLVVLVMLNRLTGDRQGRVHLPQGRLEVSRRLRAGRVCHRKLDASYRLS